MLRKRIWVWLLAAVLASGVFASADEHTKKSDTQASATTEPQKEPALTNAVRVSTDAALRKAAQEKAKEAASGKDKKSTADKDVLEFRPAAPGSAPAEKDVVVEDSKKSPVKNVHGEVYGTTGSGSVGTRGAGAAVGASSRSGKTSVYVETQRSRTTPPH
jgi:hypothetical protein